MNKPVTKNQQRLIDIAATANGRWVQIAGICMEGQFSGRGRGTVIRSLEKRGLIEVRMINIGLFRPLYRESICITDEGRKHASAIAKMPDVR